MARPRNCFQASTLRVAVASMRTLGVMTFQPVRAQVDTMTRFTGSVSASTTRETRSYMSCLRRPAGMGTT